LLTEKKKKRKKEKKEASQNVILQIRMKPCKFGMRECACRFLKMGSKLKKNSWLELLGQLINVFSKLAQLGLIRGGG
jgi:hypothetical protein